MKPIHAEQLNLALKNRDTGIARVTCANATFIETMRSVARMIARKQGTVTADDLREYVAEHPEIERPTSHNAYGAIFRCKDFRPVGYVVSRQPQGHGNRVMRWALSS